MTNRRLPKSARAGHLPKHQGNATYKTVAISSYVMEIVRGVRCLTRQSGQQDIAFLDHLLAMAEEEASNLATNVYH